MGAICLIILATITDSVSPFWYISQVSPGGTYRVFYMDWFIQIHRKILEWEWYSDTPTKVLFLHLLFTANYKESRWRWEAITPWQLLTGRKQLSQQTGLSEQQVRTALEKLENTWEVTSKVTNLYTILTLNNWATYNQQSNQRITNEQPTDNQRITTSNKDNNINKDNKEIVATQPNEYLESIKYLKNIETEHIPEYVEDHREEWMKFCLYWSEKGKTWKIRAEGENTFEIKKRFATWMGRKKEQYQKAETRIPRGTVV